MTLNDLEWLFRIKFCFRAGLAGSATVQPSKNNCVKSNRPKDRHVLSAAHIFGRTIYSFWQYKVCVDIRWGSLV